MSRISPLWILAIAVYVGAVWAAVFNQVLGRRRQCRGLVDYLSSCGGFVALALMLTLPLPPVMATLDGGAGLVGLADLLADAAALLACLAWLVYLARLVPPDQRWLWRAHPGVWVPLRPLMALIALTIAVGAGRFIWAPGRLGYDLGPQPDAPAKYLAGAHLVYRATIVLQLGLLIVVLRRLVTKIGDQILLQARLLAIRGWIWYTIARIAYECVSIFFPFPNWLAQTHRQMSLLLLIAIAAPNAWYRFAIALWQRSGDTLHDLRTHWHGWQAYRRIYPLWASLYPVRPGISLLKPPSRCRAWWPGHQGLTFSLCRMVTEIDDWRIRLRPYQPSQTATIAEELAAEACLPSVARPALVEAITLAAALTTWRAGVATDTGRASDVGYATHGGGSLMEEIAELERVAIAFVHSPLVPQAMVRLEVADTPQHHPPTAIQRAP